ncbi:phage tail protein [Denitromonas sp.]|uniref:phage tail protein n=1 Tax=Denitromonas sp. TaxID=2734609 RepID=UPI003A85B45E
MSLFFATLTNVGAAKRANAEALGEVVQITHMAVGDGNGAATVPSMAQTALVNEKRRAPLNTLDVDPLNAAQIIAEQVIPENVGGWWIREIGLFDADGDLVAVANCPDTYKPLLAEGSGRTQVIRMVLLWGASATVQLKIDPAVVLATREFVQVTVSAELRKHAFKKPCRVATTANLAALSGLLTIDGVVLVAGERVLVKDQTTPSQNGIYVVAVGAWTRAADADDGTKLTSGATVPVEAGTTQADTVWLLTTDGAITVGVTALNFILVNGNVGYAKTNATQTFTKGQAGAEAALPATTGSVTLDLATSNNFGGTLTGNITLSNPSTMPVGQSGVIRIVNDATPRTIAYGSYWKAAAGYLPALTATAGATDDLVYYVESATRIILAALGDTK